VSHDLRLWVIDTSTVIEVRQLGVARRRQEAIFRKLTVLAEAHQLIFPPQVLEELEWAEREYSNDQALAWARGVRDRAMCQANLETVRKVLARAPNLIDADSEREQADPYVIALALDSTALGGTSILSNDMQDRRDGRGGFRKLSIGTVAGSWDIQVVPLAGFLLRFQLHD
jgi:hypothetical protein